MTGAMTISKTVTLVCPVLNEDAKLRASIETTLRFIDSAFADPEKISLLIADNGSTDQTEAIGRQLVAQYPGRVQYLRLQERGVGRALKAGWGAANTDIVGYMDIDLATDLRHLPEALQPLLSGAADIVTGTRLAPGARVVGRSLKRTVTSYIFNFLVRTYLRVKISDAMCGFKFLRRDILPQLQAQGAESNGWFFCAQVLIIGEYLKFRIQEIPVSWKDSPDSKVRVVSLGVAYLKEMYALRKRKFS
jgi:glycosyltransferase involved in cell wall biosynthesis